MSPRKEAPLRRFWLAASPAAGEPRLLSEDAEHALRVLRVRVGDRLLGLDGEGAEWPLAVTRTERRELVLEAAGEPRREPRPGEPGSPLPAVELALAFPRPSRAAELLDRLCQLGATRITPLETAHGAPASELRREKLERQLRESCKQSGRLWPPVLAEPAPLERAVAAAPGPCVVLEPGAPRSLLDLARELPPEATPTLFVGPEGGFAAEELELLEARGADRCRLTSTVLRIETAAELATGVMALVLSRHHGTV